MQYLKDDLQFNVSHGSISSIDPIPTDVFRPRDCLTEEVEDEINPLYLFGERTAY